MTEHAYQLDILRPQSVNNTSPNAQWGTFRDSLREPVHRWFTYPAGYSHRAVEYCLKSHNIGREKCVYDPFMGTGTTNVVSKSLGISSIGVEAHPFVYRVARTKLDFELPLGRAAKLLSTIEENVKNKRCSLPADLKSTLEDIFPELVIKCFLPPTLHDLLLIRDEISQISMSKRYSDFFNVALTAVLRKVANVHTGWPYIAPKKIKNGSKPKDALLAFTSQVQLMVADLQIMKNRTADNTSQHSIFEADARDTSSNIEDNSADFIITSPPYLNNYDYADRTRLEMYFFGEATCWGDISRKVRTKLMTSATTQISRSDKRYELSNSLEKECPEVYEVLSDVVLQLSELRLLKGGRKDYDMMVAGYFNDIFLVLKDTYRILKTGSRALFVLGDSAPYGVHVKTDQLVGIIGQNIGYSSFDTTVLRKRGGKWKENPQRHNVELRESIITLIKE
ncbi:MAG: hypothetical protein KAT79_01885 [candidate division Zixibacteria bacterium]|nr:hypothetical protein [candidate division Zixibacteria bacterium]